MIFKKQPSFLKISRQGRYQICSCCYLETANTIAQISNELSLVFPDHRDGQHGERDSTEKNGGKIGRFFLENSQNLVVKFKIL